MAGMIVRAVQQRAIFSSGLTPRQSGRGSDERDRAYLWDWRATHATDGTSLVDPAKFQLLTRSAVAACDGHDGVKDGVIDDPRQCRFDPASLLCKTETSASCLTRVELDAVQAVYAGPKNPRTGEQIFPGWPLGSEGYGPGPGDGWRNFLDVPEPRRVGLFQYFVFKNPAWDFWSMDWDRDVAFTNRTMGFLNATAHDLSGGYSAIAITP